ncbi:MAG: 23S rRNA pseudouridine2605 synthase [Parvibaculaceae bacterium]
MRCNVFFVHGLKFTCSARLFGPFLLEEGMSKVDTSKSKATENASKKASDQGEKGDGVERQRIAKYLARAGVCSRRDAEKLIEDGRVTVDHRVLTTPAFKVTGREEIVVDGKIIPPHEPTRLWRLHKPRGCVTTNKDPEGRVTVFDRLPENMPRVISIGRLDYNTEGLLLFTNDGELARTLELPQTGWTRRYRIRAYGRVTQSDLDELQNGIEVDGIKYGPIEATLDREQGDNVWITMRLTEGKNREIKRVLGELGLDVNRLIRLSYGPFQLGDIPEGTTLEIPHKTLVEQVGHIHTIRAKDDDNKKKFSGPKGRGKAGKKPFKKGGSSDRKNTRNADTRTTGKKGGKK